MVSPRRPWGRRLIALMLTFPIDRVCGDTDWIQTENGTMVNGTKCRTTAEAKAKSQNWTRLGVTSGLDLKVDYCLSKKTEEHCRLKFSTYILATVISCNLIKIGAMIWVLWRQGEITFVTWGDAICSWLENPDKETGGYCMKSASDLTRAVNLSKTRNLPFKKPQAINTLPSNWGHAATKRRWIWTTIIVAIALVASLGCFLGFYDQMTTNTAESIVSLGFGVADPRMLLSLGGGSLGLVGSVLFANLPQLILSLVYLSLNALFTAMHMALEYRRYQSQRKALRVTTPRGQQRKTYWLQLPFVYGLPMIAISGTLHWLISQGMFLVQFDVYADGVPVGDQFSSVGLSPSPMLAVFIVGLCILIILVGLRSRDQKGQGMPVAGNCSFALAAAAHRPEWDVDAAFLPVKWGEVVEMGNDEVGHCCFTSQEVVEVVPQRLYAGDTRKDL